MTTDPRRAPRGAYADSVTPAPGQPRRAAASPACVAAQVAMATPLNVEVLAEMGFDVLPGATPNDMVVAVRARGRRRARTRPWPASTRALAAAGRRPSGPAELAPPRDHGGRAARRTRTRSCWSRCPGASAFVEAMDALDAGRDVMVFSDNVPVEQEVALKRAAAERGLLVMGPDCGTAVVGGVGLGFANVVAPGPVGHRRRLRHRLPAAARLLDHAGVGVTSRPRRRRPRPVRRRSAGCPPARRCAGSTRTRASS